MGNICNIIVLYIAISLLFFLKDLLRLALIQLISLPLCLCSASALILHAYELFMFLLKLYSGWTYGMLWKYTEMKHGTKLVPCLGGCRNRSG